MVQDLAAHRAANRRFTLMSGAASAAAIALVPLAYRGGAGASVVVLVPAVSYLLVSLYRMMSGFQVERQMDLEFRFLQFARRQGRLLTAGREVGKIWRYSCLVQGLSVGTGRVVPAAERGAVIRRALRASGRLLRPSGARAALPLVGAMALAWMVAGTTGSGMPSAALYLVALPATAAVFVLEIAIDRRRMELRLALDGILDGIAEAAFREFRNGSAAVGSFRHRMLYRDPLRTG